MLELARPADWQALSRLWQGMQAELGLPAPAIAINGQDGYQLWFSFAEALPSAQAAAFVDALRARYLPEIAAGRISITPSLDAAAPPAQSGADQWSAFVAPDLAPVFAEEPWLNMPPNPEGQADLLTRLKPIKPDVLHEAWERLGGAPRVTPISSKTEARPDPVSAEVKAEAEVDADPRRFLLRVMNDESVPMALRIEAAKALMPRG